MFVYFIHAIITWLLTGLIWTVQLVHYPFFKFSTLSKDAFLFHQRQISFLVMPLMITELLTGIYLLIRDWPLYQYVNGVNVLIIFLLWIHTFAIMVPLHQHLLESPSKTIVSLLVKHNWARTLAWRNANK